MPKPCLILAAALASAAAPALAGPFDGTWKTDLAKSTMSAKPEIIALSKGVYSCASCTPPLSVPADGKFHAVAGRTYTDSLAVMATGPRSVVVKGRKGDKPVSELTLTVSADGRTLTTRSTRTNLATGASVSGTSTATRVAAAPAKANPISGSWKNATNTGSDNALMQTFSIKGDVLTLTTPTGEGYVATFGGPPVPQKNDPGKTMIAVRRLAPDHIVETDSRDGKPVQVYDMKVAPDGRTMTMAITDKRNGETDTLLLVKQ